MRSFLRPAALIAAFAGLCAYATIMLRGPQGLEALREKHREIEKLEERNADLRRELQEKQARIERLKHDADAQELEIRKRLKMQREGDTQFVLPDQPTRSDSGPAN
ncbi:MAG: septum formation initiator family protein [Acidobacteriaceae bacterium]|nr:septum formation initiator family protein [Acidobacteriaceae bacterium]